MSSHSYESDDIETAYTLFARSGTTHSIREAFPNERISSYFLVIVTNPHSIEMRGNYKLLS